ncbi:MAG: hypothetical protein INR71_12930 [Terriglobus roseus]|nr:hypothetical protein [Terriglobus roseus]
MAEVLTHNAVSLDARVLRVLAAGWTVEQRRFATWVVDSGWFDGLLAILEGGRRRGVFVSCGIVFVQEDDDDGACNEAPHRRRHSR